MAEHLASIFGTEKDRVNCPFYFKIGACRHGDRCSRLHNKPTISPTIILSHMYQRLDVAAQGAEQQPQQPPTAVDERAIQEHFEDFYEDLFEELSKHGEIESLNVCDNVADHMIGNVYVQFREEEQANMALQALRGRFYAGRPIMVDFSPVTDFREATCRQYEENTCNRGGYCNFMHLRKVNRDLRRQLFGDRRRRERSRSPRGRGAEDDHRGGGGGYRDDYHRGGGRDDRGGRGRRDDYFEGDDRGRRDRRGGDRRDRSPVREGSEERRAKIEQWNREKEERDRRAAEGAAGGAPEGGEGYGADRGQEYNHA